MQDVAPASVHGNFVRVKSVKPAGREDAYNMEVEWYHNFAINGGLIVHNCESLRYGLMSRPAPKIITVKQKKERRFDPFSTGKKPPENGFFDL